MAGGGAVENASTTTTTTGGGPTEALPGDVPFFFIFFLPQFWGILFAILFEYVNLEGKIANVVVSLGGSAHHHHHPYALLGLAFFALVNAGSYLSGCVVCARLEFGIKLPNLYADKRDNKNAVLFNCIQRGHQNYVENLPIFVSRYSVPTFFASWRNRFAVVNLPHPVDVSLLCVMRCCVFLYLTCLVVTSTVCRLCFCATQIASALFTAVLAKRPNIAGLMLLVVTVARIFFAKGYKSQHIEARFPFFLVGQFAGSVGVGYAALLALSIVGMGPFASGDSRP
jgi:hypothetical protein